jgi:transposase
MGEANSTPDETAIFAHAVDACASGKVSFFRFSPELVLWVDRQIKDAKEETALWKERWEAERRDHEATMKHCDRASDEGSVGA